MGNECPPSPQIDPRIKRTRKLLQEALHSLLLEKSFATISVQDIAERATVNRATFYAHYLDKHDLIGQMLKTDLRNTIFKKFVTRPAFTQENLVTFAMSVFEFLGERHSDCPKAARELQDVMGTALQSELYEILEVWLRESGADVRLFPNCSRQTVSTVLSCSIYGGAYRWSRSDRQIPARTICQEMISLLFTSSNNAYLFTHA